MNFVFSTLTAANSYVEYQKVGQDLNRPVRTVTIKGGANLADKMLVTPLGVATEVSDDDLDFLEKHPNFVRHRERGFVTVRRGTAGLARNANDVAKDMTKRDGSAPLTPQHFRDEIMKRRALNIGFDEALPEGMERERETLQAAVL